MRIRTFVSSAVLLLAGCGPMQMTREDAGADVVHGDAVATDTPTTVNDTPTVDVPTTTDTGPRDSGPPSGNVDPNCTDGRYTETLPDVNASISDVTFDASMLGA